MATDILIGIFVLAFLSCASGVAMLRFWRPPGRSWTEGPTVLAERLRELNITCVVVTIASMWIYSKLAT